MKFIVLALSIGVLAKSLFTQAPETITQALPPAHIAPEQKPVSAPPPPPTAARYRHLRNAEVTPQLGKIARNILITYRSSSYGTGYHFNHGGRSYMGRIEEHYHPPGGDKRPWGHHKGVTLYTAD
jgi:hypothetical protein